MSDLACVCGVTREPAARIKNVAVCASCGATVVISDLGPVSRAMLKDIEGLSALERAKLTRAHAAIARPKGVSRGG
jgi:hypothetical protein